jgi:hypothetical protein
VPSEGVELVSIKLQDRAGWVGRIVVEDFAGDLSGMWEGDAQPVARFEGENLLMYGGASALLELLQGNGTATAGQALTHFNAAQSAIGAGNGNTAAAATQTNLVGASKLRKGMDSGYPAHTDGVAIANRTITFRATFSTGEANFDWQEVGVFNSASDGQGRMLNRLVQNIGVKTSAVSRVVTVTIDLS